MERSEVEAFITVRERESEGNEGKEERQHKKCNKTSRQGGREDRRTEGPWVCVGT